MIKWAAPAVTTLLLFFIMNACSLDSKEEPKGVFTFHESIEPFTWDQDSVESEFRQFLSIVNATPDSASKQELVDTFFLNMRGEELPYIEDNILAHFFYYDSTFSNIAVQISGDFNNWDFRHISFKRLDITNFYYYSRIIEPDARIEYKYVINGITQKDPYNPNIIRFGDIQSELAMPLYEYPSEIDLYDIPHGNIESMQYAPSLNEAKRLLRVYLPPDYNINYKYPTLYFNDGEIYFNSAHAVNTLDYLIFHKLIRPVIAVFVNPISRNFEYLYNEDFSNMFAKNLVPFIDTKYKTDPRSESRAILGFSFGGISSLFTTIKHFNVFGNCAAFSPALHSGDMVDQFEVHPYFNAKIYLDAGTYENWIYEPALQLANILSEKNFDGHFYTWHEYHSIGSWSAHLDNALIYFFPYN